MAENSQGQNFPEYSAPPQDLSPERQRQNQHPLANYHFSPEEMQVLRECNTESFFQRSLPLGTAFGVGTYFGVKRGFLTPNIKYGAAPKVVVSVIVGYFIGKFSYQNKCAQKMMRLPNSKLGELLRQRQKGNIYSSLTPDQGLGAGFALPSFGDSAKDLYTDEGLKGRKSNSLELDTDRPVSHELDDIYRPTIDDSGVRIKDEQLNVNESKITYDELRKKNREEYLKKSQSPFSRPLPPDAPIVIRSRDKITSGDNISSSDGEADRATNETSKLKNKYGDVWTS